MFSGGGWFVSTYVVSSLFAAGVCFIICYTTTRPFSLSGMYNRLRIIELKCMICPKIRIFRAEMS